MKHLQRLERGIKISFPTDENGLVGRECPNANCLGYFKIKFGTGLKGENLPCHCPYCGHTGGHDSFWTQEQIAYARSVAFNEVRKALRADIAEIDRSWHQSSRGSLIQLSIKYQGHLEPIRFYREKQLETVIACDTCTLHYAIYGVFAFCPDCGIHNSRQILEKNLELAAKEIRLAETADHDLAEHLIADALENAVSAFDGFGREACRVRAAKSTAPDKAENVSFQNLTGARQRVQELFGFDFAAGIDPQQWKFAHRCFQKRHLLAHKMGVVDEAYLKSTNDRNAVVGRKITITPDEVTSLIEILKRLGAHLVDHLPG